MADRVETQPVTEPVEQRSDAPTPTLPRKRRREDRHASGRRVGAEFGLLRLEFLGGEDGEDHVLDAEAGVDRVELCGEQLCEVARVAGRPGGAEADVLDAAVDAVKTESETACAHSLARQPRREILDKPLDRAGEIGGIGDRLGKAQPHPPARRLAQGRQWLRQIAKGLVEPVCHAVFKPIGTKAAGQRIARHRIELADMPEADPAQTLNGVGVEPQRLDRQGRERGTFVLRCRECRLAGVRGMARQGPGGAQRARDRDAVRDLLS